MNTDQYTKLPSPSLLRQVIKLMDKEKISKKKPLKVIIFGYFGVNNIGDDAILLAEINELNRLSNRVEITVPSQNPQFIKEKFNVSSVQNKDILNILISMLKTDIVIFGGGGLICKIKDNSSLLQKINDDIFTIYKSVMYFLLPKLLGKRLIIFGIGAYPNISKFQKLIYFHVLTLANVITVRDKISYNFLTANISKDVKFEKDVAFLLDDDDISPRNKIKLNSLLLPDQKKIKVGISLLTTNINAQDEQLIFQIKQIVDEYSNICDFYFFPFYVEPSVPNDNSMAKDLCDSLNNSKSLKIIPYSIGAGGFHYLFSQLNFSISMRFHAQVFSYKAKIPFVGISYDKKCESFMEQIHATYIKTEDIGTSNLYKIVSKELSKLSINKKS